MLVKLHGLVEQYKGNGRRLGYPTANIKAETELRDGVYFGFANLSKYTEKPALVFIGIPTTMGDVDARVEVHVLDIPDVDYYGDALEIQIEKFHRPNQKFNDVPTLIAEIHKDETEARKWFESHTLREVA